jgi:hypothetical protein
MSSDSWLALGLRLGLELGLELGLDLGLELGFDRTPILILILFRTLTLVENRFRTKLSQ